MLPLLANSDALLDVSFLTALPALFTFSRASTATYLSAGTVLSAASGVARFEASGLLAEPQTTNLLTYSVPQADGSGGWWYSTGNTSAILAAASAPDGTATAVRVTESTSTTDHCAINNIASFTSGTSYTFSLHAKAGSATVVQIALPAAAFGSTAFATFDLAGGVVGSVGASVTATKMVALGGGWYRCGMTAPCTTTSAGSSIRYSLTNNVASAGRDPSYTGTGLALYLWGLQTEAGAAMTSYIPTTGSTATRAADVLSMNPATAVPAWQSAAGYSMALEVDVLANSGVPLGVCGASGFSSATYLAFYAGSSLLGNWTGGGSPSVPAAGATLKIAMAITPSGTVTPAVNGTAAASGTETGPPTLTTLSVMSCPWTPGASSVPGHVRRLRLWNTALNSAALAAATK